MMIDESKILSLSSVKNYTPAMILILTQTFVISSVAFKIHWATSNTKINNENYSFNSQEIINTISNILYSEYIICLLAATIILLIGLIASIAIASKITKSKF